MVEITVELICPYCRQKSRHEVDAGSGQAEREFLCKHPTSTGEPCERTVDSQHEYCWAHSLDE